MRRCVSFVALSTWPKRLASRQSVIGFLLKPKIGRADMHDLVIRGGTVVDGSGAPRFTADVGIKDGMIAEIGRITSAASRAIGLP